MKHELLQNHFLLLRIFIVFVQRKLSELAQCIERMCSDTRKFRFSHSEEIKNLNPSLEWKNSISGLETHRVLHFRWYHYLSKHVPIISATLSMQEFPYYRFSNWNKHFLLRLCLHYPKMTSVAVDKVKWICWIIMFVMVNTSTRYEHLAKLRLNTYHFHTQSVATTIQTIFDFNKFVSTIVCQFWWSNVHVLIYVMNVWRLIH